MAATKDLETHVILVNEQDQELGSAPKLAAHEQGLLHRAFSIFIFRQVANTRELLLQQRAASKYHSPSLWTNTCCSHPHPGEALAAAATRRLKEELNLSIPLRHIGHFQYKAFFPNGLTENELDHVFVGTYSNEEITPNPAEIQAYRWQELSALRVALTKAPEQFTPWLGQALDLAENGGVAPFEKR
jgi:isopentenyl-diphosphate delta-isomerase type 1